MNKGKKTGPIIEVLPASASPVHMQRTVGFGVGTSARALDGPSTHMYIQFQLPDGSQSPKYAFPLTSVPALCEMIMTAVERNEARK